MAANCERSVNLQDFILDELSILQYRRFETQWGEVVNCKLVVIDFLDGESGEKRVFCSKCEQNSEQLKLCSGCRNSRYCSITCQKADWPMHKITCSILAEKIKK